jgi:hypothetical protein
MISIVSLCRVQPSVDMGVTWTVQRSAEEWHAVPRNGMFHVMWNEDISGTKARAEPPHGAELVALVYKMLRTQFPPSWHLDTIRAKSGSHDPDIKLALAAPDGTKTSIAVEVKRRVDPRDVPHLLDQHSRDRTADALPIAAPFLGLRTREQLSSAGVSYADATGNLRLELDRPVAFIATEGATSNPWKEFRPLHSLKGPVAGRVVRALCDFRAPFGTRALAERAGASAASTSRVVALLDREALLTRSQRGTVTEVDWPQLIVRWAQDYSLTTSNVTRTFLEPRGLDTVLRKLNGADWRYAVTGSLAAARVAPIAPPRLAVIYVDDIEQAAERLKLWRADSGANVLLVRPFDTVVFDRTLSQDGITYAAPSQVVADLLTSPGRGPAAAEELLRWMKDNEHAWRH